MSTEELLWIAIGISVLSLLAMLSLTLMYLRLRQIDRQYFLALLPRPTDISPLAKALAIQGEQLGELAKGQDHLRGRIASLAENDVLTSHGDRLNELAAAQEEFRSLMRPLTASDDIFIGPVASMSFSDSLDPSKYEGEARAAALRFLSDALARQAGDGVSIAANSASLLQSGGQMIVTLSPDGQQLLAIGVGRIPTHAASGRALPVLINSRTGRTLEMLKEAKGARAISQLANLAAAVVGAAHLIAGADIAKKLNQLNKKVDLLLAYRRIDHVAKLERIFNSAREISRFAPGASKRLELWRLRGELRELRSIWRREFEHHLRQIEAPEEIAWISRTFSTQRSLDRDVHQRITPGHVQIGLIEYALRLDHVLAIGSGTIPEFETSLAHEVRDLELATELLQEKAAYIRSTDGDLSAEPLIREMKMIVEHCRPTVASTLISSEPFHTPTDLAGDRG